MTSLHSNLVIFKYDKRLTYKSFIMYLYIPIWLYSNRLPHILILMKLVLYIPIWLYSNDNAYSAGQKLLCFTFQSGYIQIDLIEILARLDRPLHSNLVIFKYDQYEINRLSNSLYIPIWLYSNLKVRL